MITGAFAPDAGRVRVFGLDPEVDGDDVRARCGVVSAKPALYDRLSGLDNLRYSAELYGLGRGAAVDARIHEAAARFGIDAALARPGRRLLHRHEDPPGARPAACCTEPELLLYDEPTSGLDPESSHAVLELIHEMTDDGSTVVMCTHLLLEAEGLADQVVVLQDGVDVINGSPDELTKRYWPDAMVRLGADDVTALDALAQHEGVVGYDRTDHVAVVRMDSADRIPDLVHTLSPGRRAGDPGRAARADARGPLLRRPPDRRATAGSAPSTGAPSDGRRRRHHRAAAGSTTATSGRSPAPTSSSSPRPATTGSRC